MTHCTVVHIREANCKRDVDLAEAEAVAAERQGQGQGSEDVIADGPSA